MDTTILFDALSSSIINSLGKGFVIFFLVKLLVTLSPALLPRQKFNLFYGAIVLIFAGFIISFTGKCLSSARTLLPANILMDGQSGPVYHTLSFHWWIGAAYCFGLAIQGLLIGWRFYALHTIRRQASSIADGKWQERVNALCSQLGIAQQVALQTAGRFLSPFTTGFFKPIIILPVALINQLTPEQTEAILLHELGHIKRNDYLLNIVLSIIEAVMFFNPFVWLLAREIRRERENACDDLVIEYTGDRLSYAHTLLKIAEYKIRPVEPALCAATNRYQLLNRIKRITDMNHPQNTSKTGTLVLMAVSACLSLAWITPGRKIQSDGTSQAVTTTLTSTRTSSIQQLNTPATAPVKVLRASYVTTDTIPSTPSSTRKIIDSASAKTYFESAEWKLQMENVKKTVAETQNMVNSPEWKKEIEQMRENAMAMAKQFDDPKWKESMRAMQQQMKEHFESADWKKQVEEMKSQSEALKLQFNSEDFKKQAEKMKTDAVEMTRQFQSEEWKNQMQELKKNSEQLKKQFESAEWKKTVEELKKIEQSEDNKQ